MITYEASLAVSSPACDDVRTYTASGTDVHHALCNLLLRDDVKRHLTSNGANIALAFIYDPACHLPARTLTQLALATEVKQ